MGYLISNHGDGHASNANARGPCNNFYYWFRRVCWSLL